MRRLPSSLLLLAALVTATAAGAETAPTAEPKPDEAPATSTEAPAEAAAAPAAPAQKKLAQATPAAEPSPAQTDSSSSTSTSTSTTTPAAGTAEDTAEKKEDEEKKKQEAAGLANARLAPGGVIAGAADRFPLRLTATLDNFAGNGFFAPGYQIQPTVGTSLSLRPSAALPKVDWLPRMLLSGSIDFSVNNWMFAFTNGGVYERQVRVSDFGVGIIMPGIYTEEITGISVTPVVSARAPLSITSRQQNLFTSAGAALVTSWNSPETPVGIFSVQYTPSIRGNLYTQDAPTIPCEASVQIGGVVTDPINQGDLPLSYGRVTEVAPNGECVLRGRQGIASIGNNLALAWSLAEHAVSITMGHGLGFLRPLSDRPDLQSEFASGQNFNETTNGSLSYTYTVPVDFQLFLTAGIASSQPIYSAGNQLRFPFYDFVTPANNFSAAFFDVSVGI